jgi:homoserine acetyltransferase
MVITVEKASDGIKAKFPEYNYTDMVRAQHLLVKEGLGVKHPRLERHLISTRSQ